MTGFAGLLDHKLYSVLIAVGADFSDGLEVSAGCAFVPDFLTGPGPIMSLAGIECLDQGLLIHPGEHQERARCGVCGNRREQPISAKFRSKSLCFLYSAIQGVVGSEFCWCHHKLTIALPIILRERPSPASKQL